MVARFHYDETTYRQLLSDELPPNETEDVTRHIEKCTSCQDKLEAVSSSDADWNNVRRFLKSDAATTPDAVAQTLAEPVTRKEQLGFLLPSEVEDSLGRFGRYEITEILGRGGMGVVMRGHDPALNRQSAIKVLAPELATSASARQRFSREAKSAAAVVHEHVVPIQTVDEHDGLPYLVMPVIGGSSLQQRVDDQGPLEIKEVLRIGMQVASGLAAAHAQGLVHRDVKPANILLENGVERVCITDFGLARAADDANKTQSGVIAGTPQYMSPEQARGNEVDHRSDLFSLGSVLYFMCTGRSPFRAETTMGVLNRICHDQPRSVRSVNSDVPVWLQEIMNRLLSKQADDRFQSVEEVASVLEQWLAHVQQPEIAPAPPRVKQPGNAGGRNAKLWLTVALGAAFLAFSMVIILETSKGTIEIDAGELNDVPIKVMKGDRIYKQLTVTPNNKSVRVAAGEYVVLLDGEQEGIEIKDGAVSIAFRGAEEVKVTLKHTGDSSDPPGATGPQSTWLGGAARAPTDDVASQLAMLAGRWRLGQVQQTDSERHHPNAVFIVGNRCFFSWPKQPDAMNPEVRRARVSVTNSPRGEINVVFDQWGRKDMTLVGKYEVSGDSLTIAISMGNNPPEWAGALPLIWRFKRQGSDASATTEGRVDWFRAFEEEMRHPIERANFPDGKKPKPDSFAKAEQATELMNRLEGVWITTGPNVRTSAHSPVRNSPVVKFKGQKCQVFVDNKKIVDGIYSVNMKQRPYTIHIASSPQQGERSPSGSLTGSLSFQDDWLIFTVESGMNVQRLELPLVWTLFDSAPTNQQTIKGSTLEEVAENLARELKNKLAGNVFAPTAEEFAASTLR